MFFIVVLFYDERRTIATTEIIIRSMKAKTAQKEPIKDPEIRRQKESNWVQNETQLAATLPRYAK